MAQRKRNPKETGETVVVEGVRVPKWIAERLPKLDSGRRAFVLGTLRRRQEHPPKRWLTREEVNELVNGR